jgi:hypothetical protein
MGSEDNNTTPQTSLRGGSFKLWVLSSCLARELFYPASHIEVRLYIKKKLPLRSFLRGNYLSNRFYFLVIGRNVLSSTLNSQLGDGSEDPKLLVAFTNQLCAHDDTFTVVVVIGEVKVITGVSSINKM